MEDLILRFLIGGTLVSAFALLAEVLRPKSFAGLMGAAPSIALATLAMTIAREGKGYVAVEGRSMVLGAIAFCVYAYAVSRVLVGGKTSALMATMGLMPVWLGVALGLWWVLLVRR